LHLRAEQEFPLDPLPVTDPSSLTHLDLAELTQIPAVALFVARAQATMPAFALTRANAPVIAAICRRLDGLPLAIELAAARLTVLSPTTLLRLLEHRLRVLTSGPHDLPLHQQTLRGTLAWSYDLLAADEQALFRRLAVFAGGAPLAAIVPVCGDAADSPQEGTQHDILNALSALLDHHLLVRLDATALLGESGGFRATLSEPRYGMLATIREYAWDQLHLHDEAATTRRAHAYYYLALAEAAEPKLRGAEQAEWLARLEAEHDNLRAALRWFVTQHEVLLALRLAGALSRFWHMHGYLSEGRAWLEEVLALADRQDSDPTDGNQTDDTFRSAYAQALNSAGVLAYRQGDYVRAAAHYEAGLSIRRLLGYTDQIANTLNNLGLIANLCGEGTRAVGLWNESLALLSEGGDSRLASLVLNNLGTLYHRRGEYQLAYECYSASLARKQELGDTHGIANGLGNLGLLARDQGEYAKAAELLDESREQHRALGDKQLTAEALRELGDLARRRGDLPQAQQLIEEGLAIARDVGDQQGTAEALVYLGRLECDRGILAHASALFEESLRLLVTLSDRRGAILCLEGLASVAYRQLRPTAAVRFFASARTFRLEIGAPLAPLESAGHDRLLHRARRTLGEADFTAAWEAGERLSFENVLAEVFAEEMASTEAVEPVSASSAPQQTSRPVSARHGSDQTRKYATA
jgi:predicted ATPase